MTPTQRPRRSPAHIDTSDLGDTGVSLDIILDVTAEYFELTRDDLTGLNTRATTNPRMIAIYLCRELTHHTTDVIAKLFHREVTSINLAERTIAQRLRDDSDQPNEQVTSIFKAILDRTEVEADEPTEIRWDKILQVKKYARVSVIRAAWAAMSAENDPLLTDQMPLYSQQQLDQALSEGIRYNREHA